jgi:phage terminase small subunit
MINEKQSKFIEAYLSSNSITEAVSKCNISRKTAYNYLDNTEVKEEIQKRKTELMQDTTLFMQSNLQKASKVLMDIINDENTPQSVKVQAINSLFSNCNKLVENTDILERIKELEAKAEAQDETQIQYKGA